jgi:hypothetical protein
MSPQRTTAPAIKPGHQPVEAPVPDDALIRVISRHQTGCGLPPIWTASRAGRVVLSTLELGLTGKIAPFTERQVDLVTTFADQAVIAIENAILRRRQRQGSHCLGRLVFRAPPQHKRLQPDCHRRGTALEQQPVVLVRLVRPAAGCHQPVNQQDGRRYGGQLAEGHQLRLGLQRELYPGRASHADGNAGRHLGLSWLGWGMQWARQNLHRDRQR